MMRKGGFVQDQNKRLVDQRQREIGNSYNQNDLRIIERTGCNLEFDHGAKRKALAGQAGQAVNAIVQISKQDLHARKKRLQSLLAENERILMEEHHRHMEQFLSLDLEHMRQKKAAMELEAERERVKLAHKKKIQQYTENDQEARILEMEYNMLQVKKAQEMQKELKHQAHEKLLKEKEEYAIAFRKKVKEELREQEEQRRKAQAELHQQTRAFLSAQIEEKKRAAFIEAEARKAEEIKHAEKLKQDVLTEKLDKQSVLDEIKRKKEVVAAQLKKQMIEKELRLKRQKEEDLQQALAEKVLVEHYVEEQEEKLRDLMLNTQQTKLETQRNYYEAQRRRAEESRQLEALVMAEHEKQMAKEALELEMREKARKALTQDVLLQLEKQSAEKEKLLQAEKAEKEKEQQKTADLVAAVREQEVQEKRKAMLAKLNYREDLKKQMDFAKRLKENTELVEKERLKKEMLEEEEFQRSAREALLKKHKYRNDVSFQI